MVDKHQIVKLTKADFDMNSKLGFQPDYYECSTCMCIPTSAEILECPVCANRNCEACLKEFTKQAKNQGYYKCTICLKEYKMKATNKLMMLLLTKVVKFDCEKCQRFWSFEEFQTHQLKGNCRRDPTATNYVSQLNLSMAQSQSNFALTESNSFAPQTNKVVVMPVASVMPTYATIGFSVNNLFVLVRDSKIIIDYNLKTDTVQKRQVKIDANFPHNFQYIQTPSGRIFLIGGGDFNKLDAQSLTSCTEILNNSTMTFDVLKRDKLKAPRHGHSICCLRDKFLIVTGSRIEKDDSHRSVEQYNIDMDIWFDQPSLNNGRYYHSSCVLADRYVYVFAGIANATRKYFNSIERLDTTLPGSQKVWEVVDIPIESFPVRQGPGSTAISANEILLFGGFGGEYLKDVYILKHNEKKIEKIADSIIKIFGYQMPTIFDSNSRCVVTADWESKKTAMFKVADRQWSLMKELGRE